MSPRPQSPIPELNHIGYPQNPDLCVARPLGAGRRAAGAASGGRAGPWHVCLCPTLSSGVCTILCPHVYPLPGRYVLGQLQMAACLGPVCSSLRAVGGQAASEAHPALPLGLRAPPWKSRLPEGRRGGCRGHTDPFSGAVVLGESVPWWWFSVIFSRPLPLCE